MKSLSGWMTATPSGFSPTGPIQSHPRSAAGLEYRFQAESRPERLITCTLIPLAGRVPPRATSRVPRILIPLKSGTPTPARTSTDQRGAHRPGGDLETPPPYPPHFQATPIQAKLLLLRAAGFGGPHGNRCRPHISNCLHRAVHKNLAALGSHLVRVRQAAVAAAFNSLGCGQVQS